MSCIKSTFDTLLYIIIKTFSALINLEVKKYVRFC